MQRQLKFKAWNTDFKEWVDDGFSIAQDGTELYICGDDGGCDIPKEMIICQWTGLLDKNGKEIYEGDIFGSEMLRCVVNREENGEYRLYFKNKSIPSISILDSRVTNGEIIGNIYENQELLTNGSIQ